MRYLLIDRVESVELGRRLVAVKNVSMSEDVFAYHFVGAPVMPGAMLIESMAQAGTVLLELSNDMKKKALLVMVEHAKFRTLVRPGDQLRIVVTSMADDSELVRMSAVIDAGGRLAADARLVFSLVDAEEFYPAPVRHLMEALYHNWLRDAVIVPRADAPEETC